MGPASLALRLGSCCDSLLALITPNDQSLEFVPFTLISPELNLSGPHSITAPASLAHGLQEPGRPASPFLT